MYRIAAAFVKGRRCFASGWHFARAARQVRRCRTSCSTYTGLDVCTPKTIDTGIGG